MISELNSWKAAVSNEVRVYQDFCDRNLALKNREDELQSSVNDLEIKETKLQKTTAELQQHLAELAQPRINLLISDVGDNIDFGSRYVNSQSDLETLKSERWFNPDFENFINREVAPQTRV